MQRRELVQTFDHVSLVELNSVAKELIDLAGNVPVWFFYGEMGSGKTTFIKTIARQLGVDDLVNSPTFSIVNEYPLPNDKKIFHFDLYRVKNEAEAFDIGMEEYIDSGHYCFIEWPEKIPSFVPARRAEVRIQIDDSNHRTIAISLHDREEKNRI
jgi:tRNA threonylcarbamoyladenosine biosynthesis protein TsaE